MNTLERVLRGIFLIDTDLTEFEDGTKVFEAWYLRMPGCIAQGDSEPEAIHKLRKLREPYLRKLDADGVAIPDPDFPVNFAETITASWSSAGAFLQLRTPLVGGGRPLRKVRTQQVA